jgi:TPR repeat protein
MSHVKMLVLLLSCAGLSRADFASGVAAYEKGDYATALHEWRPLAEKGEAAAQFNLGLLYYEGQGVPQNFSEAARWFQESAERGYNRAQLNLGNMYAIGRGVKRDYSSSYVWLSLCAAGGNQKCTAQRDEIAQKLKPAKLAEAQRIAAQWKKKE